METACERWIHLVLLISGVAVLVWSGLGPYDRLTWTEEVAPAVLSGAILAAVYRRFRFTTLAYAGAWFFSLILMMGGHYTYARVPIGNWFSDTFELSRNHFDRFGHFFQGAVPAILVREMLLRTSPLRPGKWLFFLVVCVALAISAGYELIEWFASVVSEAEDFVGSQGDVWDAQWDMFLALCGAIVVQLTVGRLHDRQIARLEKRQGLIAQKRTGGA
jgi:putative membrane protein